MIVLVHISDLDLDGNHKNAERAKRQRERDVTPLIRPGDRTWAAPPW
jgi:hypothetical protein